MSTLPNLVAACQADEALLREQAQSHTENWQSWLTPVSDANPTGEDPGYDDDFQRIREEVNKLSGIDTGLICQLAEKLLTSAAKDTPLPKKSPFSRCRWSTPACRLTLTDVRSSACALTAAISPTGAVSISASSRSISTQTHRWPALCMKPLP